MNATPSPATPQVDLHRFRSQLTWRNKLLRLVWGWVWFLAFRPSPRICFGWRRLLLRCFGGQIAEGVRVYSSVRVFYPPHLRMDSQAILGEFVDCYCVAPIRIGANAMVSQYSYLCAASHDDRQAHLPLIAKPITIEPQAWVCADCFIGPGVTIGAGAVVGARSTVVKDVAAWTVVAGNPPRVLRTRTIDG